MGELDGRTRLSPGRARVLLNDAMTRADEAGAREDCLAQAATRSRGAVPFVK